MKRIQTIGLLSTMLFASPAYAQSISAALPQYPISGGGSGGAHVPGFGNLNSRPDSVADDANDERKGSFRYIVCSTVVHIKDQSCVWLVHKAVLLKAMVPTNVPDCAASMKEALDIELNHCATSPRLGP